LDRDRISGSPDPAGRRRQPRAWFTPAVFFAFAGIVWLATRGPGTFLDLFEHGHWLAPASDILAGKVPYRETFPMHGFLSDGGRDYLRFRLFGASYRLSIDARHVLESLFHPVLFLVAATASRRPVLAALAIPVNLGMSIAVVADRPVFPLLSLAAFAWALGEERSRGRAFLAGLLVSRCGCEAGAGRPFSPHVCSSSRSRASLSFGTSFSGFTFRVETRSPDRCSFSFSSPGTKPSEGRPQTRSVSRRR
jgi:hypothetical protein